MFRPTENEEIRISDNAERLYCQEYPDTDPDPVTIDINEIEKAYLYSSTPCLFGEFSRLVDIVDVTRYPNIYYRLGDLTFNNVRQMSIREFRNKLEIEPPDVEWNQYTWKEVKKLDQELIPFVEEYLQSVLKKPQLCEMIHDEYFGSSNEPKPAEYIRCLMWVCQEHMEHEKRTCKQCRSVVCMECGGAYIQVPRLDDEDRFEGYDLYCQDCDHEDI